MSLFTAEKKIQALSFLRRHPVLLAGALAAGMMLCVYMVRGIWPFGELTVITGDLNGQYIPYFSHYQRFFNGEAGFFYGFDKSLGGPLAALFAYYVASPLNLLYLLVPVTGFAAMAGLVFALKVVLAAMSMSFFLHKKFEGLGILGVVPALGYAFSAYVFVYAQNIMWHDVLILLPLVCFALDRLLKGKGFLLYSVLLALMVWVNFYIAFMACIFLVLYVLCGFVLRKSSKRDVLRESAKFLGASLLGGGLTAVLLVPTVFNLNNSKGTILGAFFSLETQFPLWSLPEQLVFANFQWPQVMDGNPLLYCGLLLPLLALCFFAERRIPLREKLCAGGVLLILLLSFWVKGLDNFWHGLAEPVWFPHRYAWLFTFVLAVLSAAALAKGAVTKRSVAIAGVGLAGVFLLLGPVSQTAGVLKLALSALGVLAYAFLLWLYQINKIKRLKEIAVVFLLLAVCAELSLSGFLISRKFEPYPGDVYVAFVEEVGGTLHTAQEENPQYRVEKNFYRTLNDPMLLDYHGISHFGSTQDNAATDTLWNLGYRGNGSYLYGSTAFSDSVLSLRVLLADEGRLVPAHWQEEGEGRVGSLYENPYALPLLFTIPTGTQGEALVQWENSFAYQNELYRVLTGGEETLLKEVNHVERQLDGEVLEGLTGPLPAGAGYVVEAEEEGYYYALAVAENPYMDLDLLLDGQAAGKIFSADQNGVVNLGYRTAGEEISLGFAQGGDLVMEEIYFAYLPVHPLEALAEEAAQNSGTFQIDNAQINASITAEKGRETLFLAIPYDAGWQATVNGKTAEPFAVLGGLMALPLESGENEVQLRYQVPGLTLGICLSGVALAALAVWAALSRRRQKK